MTVIETYKGYQLKFSKYGEVFEAYDKEERITTSSSFSGLKANVDAFIKRKKKVKPFDIIQRSRDRIVRLTTIASEKFDEIWVSWKDPKETRRSRSKESIKSRWGSYGKEKPYYFYKVTPENEKILNKILLLEHKRDQLNEDIETQRTLYNDPITEEMLEKLVNPTKKEE